MDVLQQNNILLEQNALIYEISIKTMKYRGFMGNQQGLIGWNLYTRKGCPRGIYPTITSGLTGCIFRY